MHRAHRPLLAVLALLGIASCKDKPVFAEHIYQIRLYNSTGSSYAALLSYRYPDTLLPAEKPLITNCPADNTGYIESRDNWAKVFEGHIPSGTMQLFLLDTDSAAQSDWTGLRQRHSVVRRLELTLPELERLSFKIQIQ